MNNPLVQPDPGLFIWTIITFLLLLVLLARYAWKPLLAFLASREETIKTSLRTTIRFGDNGISAHLAVRGRGQAPQPRSGAPKAPGLRSASPRQTINRAARHPLHGYDDVPAFSQKMLGNP